MENHYTLLQLSWGLIQNISGLFWFLAHPGRPHAIYRGAIVTLWKKKSSAAVGMFIFLSDAGYPYPEKRSRVFDPQKLSPYMRKVLNHEYGHTLQSVLLGPLFLPLIALPSTLWAAFGTGFRRKHHISYYRFYPERWANRLGSRVTGEETPDF